MRVGREWMRKNKGIRGSMGERAWESDNTPSSALSSAIGEKSTGKGNDVEDRTERRALAKVAM